MPLPDDIFGRTYRLGAKVAHAASNIKIAFDDLREGRDIQHVRSHYRVALDALEFIKGILSEQDSNDIKIGLIMPILEFQMVLERINNEQQRMEAVPVASRLHQLVLKMNENLFARCNAIRCS